MALHGFVDSVKETLSFQVKDNYFVVNNQTREKKLLSFDLKVFLFDEFLSSQNHTNVNFNSYNSFELFENVEEESYSNQPTYNGSTGVVSKLMHYVNKAYSYRNNTLSYTTSIVSTNIDFLKSTQPTYTYDENDINYFSKNLITYISGADVDINIEYNKSQDYVNQYFEEEPSSNGGGSEEPPEVTGLKEFWA
jgi:hypothetical protein